MILRACLALMLWCLLTALGFAQEGGAAPSKFAVTVTPAGVSQAPPIDVTLTATAKHGVEPYTYAWDLDDDQVYETAGQSVRIVRDEPGFQRIAVRVIDAEGNPTGEMFAIRALTPLQVQESYGYLGATIALLLSSGLFFLYFLSRQSVILAKASAWTFIAGTLALTYSLVFRSVDMDRLPNIHLYEVLQLFAMFALFACWWVSYRYKDARPMAYCATTIGLLLLYLSSFPPSLKDPGLIQPALQSYWRNIHVTAIILSYGGIAAAFFASVSFLVSKSKLADHMAYKSTMFAYPLLTAGIIMGGMWANEAWGTYWSWDPKETSSLVIWLVLTAYLHTRLILGWSGSSSAWLSIAGFASMLYCFVGLNFAPGNSLHKYAGTGMAAEPWFWGALMLLPVYVFVSHRNWGKGEEKLDASEDITDAGKEADGSINTTGLPRLKSPHAQRGHVQVGPGRKGEADSASETDTPTESDKTTE